MQNEQKQLADQFKVEESKVSFSRHEYTEAETKANEQADTAPKAQVVFGAQKEVKQFGSLRIGI